MKFSYLLILGAPRSGTTLLATMVGRHTEIGVLNEDKGWAMKGILGKQVMGNKRCVPNQIELRRRSRFHFRFLKTLGLALEYQSSKYSIEDYLSLPGIRIIGLIRDGNDVISSIMNRSEKSFRAAAYRWRRAIEVLHHLKTRYPDIVLIVSFENLVLRPKDNMRRVSEFLQLDYQDGMSGGASYNPWYHESDMNTEKVHRSKKAQIDFRLRERFPEVFKRYEELLALAD